YESKFKRVRTFKNAPRTLDLDILYFSKKVYKTPRLIVPHPGASKRLSVIVPLGLMRG
ncbi:2-amino-4-hydroxy-6-hydroxymethyldihydropteridine diphosphokinase, partial [Campylobacter concisus]